MEKLVRIVNIHKNDAYHNDRFLIGAIGLFNDCGETSTAKDYHNGDFHFLYRNATDKKGWTRVTFYAVKVAEMIAVNKSD